MIENSKEKKKNETLVSVIVPNYNHESYLVQRLESIFNQTYTNFEVILLDDCSTDGSREIMERYRGHEKVTNCIYNSENSGSPFKQWKKGIDLAKGAYIWIAESDDVSEVTFLENLMNTVNDNTGLIYCKSKTIDEHGEVLNNKYFPERLNPIKWNKDFTARGEVELSKWHIYINSIPNASACIFKKELADFNGRLFSMEYAADWLFWARIMEKTKVNYISTTLNYWRQSPQSVRSEKNENEEYRRYKELIYCVEEMVKMTGINDLKIKNYDWLFNWYIKTIPLIRIPFLKIPDLPINILKFRIYMIVKFIYLSGLRFRSFIFSNNYN